MDLYESLLEVACIKCRRTSIKGLWSVRGGACPICNPAYRGSSNIADTTVLRRKKVHRGNV